ncbi:MAG: hypothetical protein V2A65_09965 [Candidatus Omnitrophota bacterium]
MWFKSLTPGAYLRRNLLFVVFFLIMWLVLGSMRSTAESERERFWELGNGLYTGVASDNPLDEARFDWICLHENNTPVNSSTIKNRINRNLAINPRQKYIVQLGPVCHLGNPKRYSGVAVIFDYRYKPGVREAIILGLKKTIKMVLGDINKPENVVGFSFVEELPGCWGCQDQMYSKNLPSILEEYRGQIEKERGKPLVWDKETFLWVGRVFTESIAEIHRVIKAAAPDKMLLYWHLGGTSTFDSLGHELLENAEIFGYSPLQNFYPFHLEEIDGGIVDCFIGWPESADSYAATWRYARERGWQVIFDLKHSGHQRLNRWSEAVSNAKIRDPQNMGYYFYCEGNCVQGRANDDMDPSLAGKEHNLETESIPYHLRRHCARENIGMDVVNRYYPLKVAAKVFLPGTTGEFSLGKELKKGVILELAAEIQNPRDETFYQTPEAAVAREVVVTLSLPRGLSLEEGSSPATVMLGQIRAGESRKVAWRIKTKWDISSLSQPLRIMASSTNCDAGAAELGNR